MLIMYREIFDFDLLYIQIITGITIVNVGNTTVRVNITESLKTDSTIL